MDGTLIRRTRRQLRLSRARLAELAGVDVETLSLIERGCTRRPNTATLKAIVSALAGYGKEEKGRRAMEKSLLQEVERLAEDYHDGHLTIMRFTTGWKVMFGTPELGLEGRDEVARLRGYETLEKALEGLIIIK